MDEQFDEALQQHPELLRTNNSSFSICFSNYPSQQFRIKYDLDNFKLFPKITENGSDITKLCKFYIESTYKLIDIINFLKIHVDGQKSSAVHTNQQILDLQTAANKLTSDMSAKKEKINLMQTKIIHCSSSMSDLTTLTKIDEASFIKSEVVQMKKEIQALREELASETKQFQDYLKQIAELVKKGQILKT